MLPIARHTRASLELRDSFYDLVKIQYSETACQEDFIDRHCLGENSRLQDCFVENSRLRDCCAKKSRLRDVENRSKNETARRLKISQNFARPLFFERPFATPGMDYKKITKNVTLETEASAGGFSGFVVRTVYILLNLLLSTLFIT